MSSHELYSDGVRRLSTSSGLFAWIGAPLSAFDQFCLRSLTRVLSGVPIRIVLGDKLEAVASSATPVATVRIHDRLTLARLAVSPDPNFGEAYMNGRLEVEGSLVALIEQVDRRLLAAPKRNRWLDALRRWASSNPVKRARKNVYHHYDLGNDFYRLWLDRDMVYTCAYFANKEMTLEEAQAAKHEHIARKLNLTPGETVFEAGCGWGSLSLYLARHWGVRVRAWNVSREQIAWARERAAREGLADRVEFIEDDYRNIRGACDAFVSVGMLEHVGRRQYTVLGDVIDRCLDPKHGRGLLHFIGRNAPAATSPWVAKYIFPGAHIPSLREALAVLEPRSLSVLDVENIRLHYAATLAEWLRRFEQSAGEVRAMFDERFVRMWRLYLSGSQAGFRSGNLQLFQISFARQFNNTIPLTREGLYVK